MAAYLNPKIHRLSDRRIQLETVVDLNPRSQGHAQLPRVHRSCSDRCEGRLGVAPGPGHRSSHPGDEDRLRDVGRGAAPGPGSQHVPAGNHIVRQLNRYGSHVADSRLAAIGKFAS